MKSVQSNDKQQPQSNNSQLFEKEADDKLLSQKGYGFFSKPLRARLRFGGQNDAYEHEANRMAAGIFSGAGLSLPAQSPLPTGNVPARTEPAQEKAAELEGEIKEAKAGGQPLSRDVKRHMEPAFNTDFSRVKVHTGPRAEALNSRINAYAFTYDNNIFYGKGQQPGINPLTAHELTHVAQQQGGTNISSRPVYPPGKEAQSNSAVFKKDIGTFTSTDTRDNLQAGKQQQKVSGRESPQTLRSCGGSPSFSPRLGTKTTNLKGTYGEFEVEHGLESLPTASDYGKYFFQVEMTPNDKTKGSKIAFIQTARRGAPGGKWSVGKDDPGMNADRAKRTTKEGWRLDRADPSEDKTPFYGMYKDKGGAIKQYTTTRIGEYKGARPMMRDRPSVADPTVREFAATAMDMSTGANYGTVAWGFEFDSAKKSYKEETPRLLDPADPRMKSRDEAFKKWNDVVATKGSGIDKVPGI